MRVVVLQGALRLEPENESDKSLLLAIDDAALLRVERSSGGLQIESVTLVIGS